MINLSSRILNTNDYDFFKELIKASPNWQQEECVVEKLESYLLSYSMFNGEWKKWSSDGESVGISYVLEWSPANEKPWVGTILIHPKFRLEGIGKKILQQVGFDLKSKGHKALFAGCPVSRDSWLQFLGKCGFEQFKVEKDELTSKEFMITVKPL